MDHPKRNPLQIVGVVGLAGLGYVYYTGQVANKPLAAPDARHLQPGRMLVSIPHGSHEQLMAEFRAIDQRLSVGIAALQKQADEARYEAAVRLGGLDVFAQDAR